MADDDDDDDEKIDFFFVSIMKTKLGGGKNID